MHFSDGFIQGALRRISQLKFLFGRQMAEMIGLKLRSCARPDGKRHKSIVTHPLVQLLGLSCAVPRCASVGGGVFVSLQGLGVRLPRGFTHLDRPVQCLPRAERSEPCPGFLGIHCCEVWLAGDGPISLGSSAGMHCSGLLAPDLPLNPVLACSRPWMRVLLH